MDNLISIIVPVYNVEEYLDQCVDSIVKQTYENLEIILVDDGSSDNSPEICDKWAEKDTRIKVIHKANGGASSARNAGLDIAGGDYFGFVDGDDFVDIHMFEILLDNLIKSDKKIAYCEPYRYFSDGRTEKKRNITGERNLNVRETLDELFYGKMYFSVWSKLYKREVFESIRFPEGEINEDYPILIPTVLAANGMVAIGSYLYYYRVREGSITDSYWKTDADIVLKDLLIMENQMKERHLLGLKSFKVFLAAESFSCTICLDKHYDKLNIKAKDNIRRYVKIMRENKKNFLLSKHFTFKDKLLYIMVLTRTLRPIYKMFGRL